MCAYNHHFLFLFNGLHPDCNYEEGADESSEIKHNRVIGAQSYS